MTNHDPLKRAFTERSAAAQTIDVETGLAGVHTHNSPGRRAARLGGAAVAAMLVVGGVGAALTGSDDDGFDTRVADESPVTQVPTSVPADVTVPSTLPTEIATEVPASTIVGDPVASEAPQVIITTGGSTVQVGPEVFEMGMDGITDAIDDAGGLVFETVDGIWHRRAGSNSATLIVENSVRINLIEVEVDADNAATTVFFVDGSRDAATASDADQFLYKIQLGTDAITQITRVGGGEYAATNGGVGGQTGSNTLVALAGTDGPCTAVRDYNATTGSLVATAEVCMPEGGGTAANEDLIRAADLTHDGQSVWLDGDSLHTPGDDISMPTIDWSGTVDIWGDWAVVLNNTQNSMAVLVNLITGENLPVEGTPAAMTSVRPLRSTVELPATQSPTYAPFVIDSTNYRVVNVDPDDTLNVRNGPGVSSQVQGELAPGSVVTTTGNAARLPNGDEWFELALSDVGAGWVNASFLELQPSQPLAFDFDQLPCQVGGADPANGLVPQTSVGSPASDANYVKELDQIADGACIRTIVKLGSGFDFDNPGPLAASLPAGIVVRSATDGRSVLVELPSTIEQADFDHLREGTALVSGGIGNALFVEILSGPHGASAYFDPDSATLIVDYVTTSPVPNALPVPLADQAGVIVRDIVGYSEDANGPTISGQATVNGFARPFEAQMSIELRDANGNLVSDTQWSGGSTAASPAGGTYLILANWTVWGNFSFSFDGLSPGSYVLRMSGDASAADVPTWHEVPFSVNQ